MFVENKDAILMMRSVYTICVSHYVTLCHTHIVTRFIYASLSVLNPKSVYARLRVSEGRCEARRGEASIGRSCASCDDGGGGGYARERSVVVDANDRVGENGDDDDDDDDAEDDEDEGEGDEDGDGGSRDARRGRAWERCCVRR